MSDINLESTLEGILFTMGESVEPAALAEALEISKKEVIEALENLKNKYEEENRGIRITELEGAYQMCTCPEIYEPLIKLAKHPKKQTLTDVMLETLSIIAYKQPVTRAQIEKIRGVSCEHAINKLLEYNLIMELGRANAPGRPILFGTTEDFLRSFGVSSLDELPAMSAVQMEEFKAEAEEEAQLKLDI